MRSPTMRRGSHRRTVLVLLALAALVFSACANRRLDELAVTGGAGGATAEELPAGALDGSADAGGLGGGTEGGLGGSGSTSGGGGADDSGSASGGGATGTDGQGGAAATTGGGGSEGGAEGSGGGGGGGGRQLTLGGVYHMTGFPLGSDVLAGCQTGLAAWMAAANAAGGVNGYTFKNVTYDDGNNADRSVAFVKRLINDDNIDIFAGHCSDFQFAATAPIISEAQLPVVGPVVGGNVIWYQNPNFFPVYGDQQDLYARYAVDGMVGADVKKAGILYVNVPSGAGGAASARRYMRQAGIEIVYDTGHALTESDFTAYIAGLKSNGAEAVWFIATPDFLDKFAQAARQQGWTGSVYAPWPGYYPGIRSVGEFVNGRYFVTMPHLGVDTARSQEGLDAFLAAMKRYAPRQTLNATAIQGWTTGEVIGEALRRMGDTPYSPEAFMEALRTFDAWEGTFNAPLTYVNGPNADPTSCQQILVADVSAPTSFRVQGEPLKCSTVFG